MEYEIALPQDKTISQEMGDDPLLEMANIFPAQSGLSAGIIYISTKQASHGPRVKFFTKTGFDQKSFSVSISPQPTVIANSLPGKIVKRFSPGVIEWVILNLDKLENLWNDGVNFSSEQLIDLLQSLQKISNS